MAKKYNIVKLPRPDPPRPGEPEWHVHGRGRDSRCELKPYKDENGKLSCPRGSTGHHVIPDRVFRINTPDGVKRLEGAPSHGKGLVICAKGKTRNPNKSHGKIHAKYDRREAMLGRLGNPKHTASMENVMQLASGSVAGAMKMCDVNDIYRQLRDYYYDGKPDGKGYKLDPKDLVRSEPTGKKSIDIGKLVQASKEKIPRMIKRGGR